MLQPKFYCMKAYIVTGTGTAAALQLADIPVPVIGPEEVLVKTMAIDINPVDSKTLQGAGQYNNIKNDPPLILGWGLSGVVVQAGNAVHGFHTGDEVFGLVNFPGHGKTYAEYVAVPAAHIARKPAGVAHTTAAATTLSALMAYQAMREARIRPGEKVLVQGVAGGVGFPAFQMAKDLGAYVVGTAATRDIPWLLQQGLDEAIDYTTTDFETATGNIDFVLDTLGGKNVIKAFNILSAQGRLITIPSGAGDEWKAVAQQRKVNATFLFVHSSGQDMQVLAQWLAEGKLNPRIAHLFRFADIPLIHRQMLEKRLSGKTVVSME